MGYYVEIIFSDYCIPADNVDEAFKRFIALNDIDNAKRGGQFGGEISSKDPRPEGMNYHPSRWYSWMSADYPSHSNNAEDVLEALGFDIAHGEDGKSILITGYNNKTGQEDIFLDSIYDLTTGSIEWRGEDGQVWFTDAGIFRDYLSQAISDHTRFGSIISV